MTPKVRFPAEVARAVAQEIIGALEPVCHRWVVAGSLRRGRPDVGDVEILFIPRKTARRRADDFFAHEDVNLADEAIGKLMDAGILAHRPNCNGQTMYGPMNKLLRHVASLIPVDLFTASESNWANYLVCRTGPATLNTRIASLAQAKGLKWNPYGSGFLDQANGRDIVVTTEEQVFAAVGLPCLPPEQRDQQ